MYATRTAREVAIVQFAAHEQHASRPDVCIGMLHYIRWQGHRFKKKNQQNKMSTIKFASSPQTSLSL